MTVLLDITILSFFRLNLLTRHLHRTCHQPTNIAVSSVRIDGYCNTSESTLPWHRLRFTPRNAVMAPRTRACKGLSREEFEANKRALLQGTVNTHGLPALPTELLMIVANSLPSVPVPCPAHHRPLSGTYTERLEMQRALSQTCRSLRSVFLPYTWQKIEVCALNDRRTRWEKSLATELVAQLEIVTVRDLSLAKYVK